MHCRNVVYLTCNYKPYLHEPIDYYGHFAVAC
jgi:hypothetical protein